MRVTEPDPETKSIGCTALRSNFGARANIVSYQRDSMALG